VPRPHLALALALLAPASALVLIEIALAATAGPVDRPYALRLAAQVGAAELVLAAVAALGIASLGHLRPVATAAPLGMGAALATLLALGRGLPPRVPPGSVPWPAALALALAAALAALLAFAALRRFGSPPRPPRALEPVAPVLAVGAALLACAALGLAPGSKGGLTVAAAAAATVLGACLALPRWGPRFMPTPRAPRAPRAVQVAMPASAMLAVAVAWGAGRSVGPALGPRGPGPPDVLLVVLDTTRADHAPAPAGATGRGTPALSRLAAEGARFTHAFAPSCWTVPGHATLFTGLPPWAHGSGWASPYLSPKHATLAQRFSRAGWRTAGLSANPWISPEFGYDRGFEHFAFGAGSERPGMPAALALSPALARRMEAAPLSEDKSGLTLVSEALRYLGREDPRPAFVFLNLLEPHLPYDPPRGWMDDPAARAVDQRALADLKPGRRRAGRELDALRRLYAAEVAYADQLLGLVVERLRAAGRLDRTVVLVTADHGENLGQHPPLDHQLGLWDTLVRVPLLVRYPPAVPRGRVSDDLVTLADVGDALLVLAGAEARGPSPGSALLRGPGHEAVLLEYDRPTPMLDRIRARVRIDPAPWDRGLRAIRTRDAKWVEGTDGLRLAFDLGADPGEGRDLVAAQGGVPRGFEPLKERLAALALPPPGEGGAPLPTGLSPEAAEALRSLGYIR
jgi:arylsulfatase A-like enzyme